MSSISIPLFLVLLVLVLVRGGECEVYHVQNGSQLTNVLCEKKLTGNTTITLNETHYTMQSHIMGHVCTVNGSKGQLMLTIKSANTVQPATISCATGSSRNISSFLFSFYNATVTIIGIKFDKCGFNIPMQQPLYINDHTCRAFQFNKTHSAALLFHSCNVTIERVSVINYNGFAIVSMNARNFTADNLIITNSQNWDNNLTTDYPNGSGLLILYDDCIGHDDAVVNLNKSYFTKNIEYYKNAKTCFDRSFFSRKTFHTNFVNAAGITILLNSCKNTVSIVINNVHVIGNHGTIAAGVLIAMLPNAMGTTEIAGSFFSSNVNHSPCSGSDIAFYSLSAKSAVPLLLTRTSIKGNSNVSAGYYYYGAVLISIWKPVNVTYFRVDNVTFAGIRGNVSGVCLLVIVYGRNHNKYGSVNVTMTGVIAHNNQAQLSNVFLPSNIGIFSFGKIDKVLITGNESFPTIFKQNFGSVVKGLNSDIFLDGYVTFQQNHAVNGGAMYLIECLLHFRNNTHIVFRKNYAVTSGGAIFAAKTIYSFLPSCIFRFSNNNTSIAFIDNSAELSGDSIFANPIYNCYISYSAQYPINSSKLYSKFFNISSENVTSSRLNISSYPTSIGICKHFENRSYYLLGQRITIPVYAKDRSNRFVFTLVKFVVHVNNSFKQYRITPGQKIQSISESNNETCSNLTITILSNTTVMKNSTVSVLIFAFDSNVYVNLQLKMRPCPVGFMQNHGFCDCHPILYRLQKKIHPYYIACDINTAMIHTSYRFLWLGFQNITNSTSKTFSASLYCSTTFCNLWKVSGNLTSRNSKIYISTSNHELVPLCEGNRAGLLCGQCEKDLSIVFGSLYCHKCNSLWMLLTISLHALAGVLVVMIFYALKLTLTAGTLNGIIFYSQLLQVTTVPYLSSLSEDNNFFYVVTFFISTLNLQLGFPLCFFNGMNELWKIGIGLLFPVYLLFIVVVLIFLSKYWSWISTKTSHSSVQVLVTVIHLSFAKFLIAFADTILWSEVYTSTSNNSTVITIHHVWSKDGSVVYWHDKGHFILIVFTFIMVVIFVLPYLVLLIGGRYLMRVSSKANKYLRQFYEAIHGPFKEKHNHWFTARLVLLIILYVLFSFLPYHISGTVGVVLLIMFTILQAYNKPFKTKMLNIIDIMIMKSIIATYAYVAYYTKEFQMQNVRISIIQFILLGFLFSIPMFIFVFVISYHVAQVTGLSTKFTVYASRMRRLSLSENSSVRTHLVSNASSSFYNSVSDYREPLLSDD